MSERKRIEVRCCCDARLIGWLPLHDHYARAMRTYVYPLRRLAGEREPERLAFSCAVLNTGALALKSADYPLRLLRRIDGFVQATPKQVEEAN